MYADDTVLYFTSPCTSEITEVVHDDLSRASKWMESNKLILNQSKTKTMLFGSRQNLAKLAKCLYTATRKGLRKGT